MVRSRAPLRAFQLMEDLNLLLLVFPIPEEVTGERAHGAGMAYLKVTTNGRTERLMFMVASDRTMVGLTVYLMDDG